MNPLVIGIDISKQKFDCAFSTDGKTWKHKVFDNTPKGFESLAQELPNPDSVRAAMEATGRYGDALATYLYEKGCTVSVLNPAQIRYYAKSCLTRSKTDKVDARVIAEFALKHETTPWKPLPETLQNVKALERYLETLKEDRTRVSNRLEAERNQQVRAHLEENKQFIDQQIKQIQASLKEIAKTAPDINQSVTLLQSIPGIGETTAFGLLGELPDLSSFASPKQLAAYAGLNPNIRVSGTSVCGRGSVSKVGSRLLRKLLFFPAMAAMRYNPILRAFAERLREKGKKPIVILVAVMRKLLHIIFGVLKKQQPFHAET